MPDARYQFPYFVDIAAILRTRYADAEGVLVGGNNFIYYDEEDSDASIAPDCFVAFGMDLDQAEDDGAFYLWRLGKMPDFVLEIGSASTSRRDRTFKFSLYRRLGALEYWMFDPSGGNHYGFPLRGYRLANGEYEAIEIHSGQDGDIRLRSDLLGLDLCWGDGNLRFYDPATGEYLRTPQESEAAYLESQAALTRSEAARIESEVALTQSEYARQTAESERQAAQSEIENLRAKIERLRNI